MGWEEKEGTGGEGGWEGWFFFDYEDEDDGEWAKEEFVRLAGAYVCVGWDQGERLVSRWGFYR